MYRVTWLRFDGVTGSADFKCKAESLIVFDFVSEIFDTAWAGRFQKDCDGWELHNVYGVNHDS
jgi:hypothetical protein